MSGGFAGRIGGDKGGERSKETNRTIRFISEADVFTLAHRIEAKSILNSPDTARARTRDFGRSRISRRGLARPVAQAELVAGGYRGEALGRLLRGTKCLRLETWRGNLHEHKGWVSARPVQRLPLGFKKSIDDKGVSFERSPAGAPRCFAAHHSGAGIDGEQGTIGKRYFAAVRNSARIDRAMAGPQACAGGALVLPRPAIRTAASAGPINRDACQDGLLTDRMLARRNA